MIGREHQDETGVGETHDPVPPLHRNLDAADRSLTEAEKVLGELLAGENPDTTALRTIAGAPAQQGYDELTVHNDQLRDGLGWDAPDLDARLTDAQREELAAWRAAERLSWGRDDILVVGLAGAVGILASVFDTQVDAAVRDGLGRLKDTGLLRGWENDAKRMPIDYTGPKFGGPGHRVRSAGHDIGRPLSALRQIRDGQFRGIVWEDGVRRVFTTAPGEYAPVGPFGEALTLWTKHLFADFVTPLSLPLPGWTWLYELPARDLRKFSHDVYMGPGMGDGVNMRSSLLTPMLSFLSTEAIVRAHLHSKVYRATGSPKLRPAQASLMHELLLAGHSLVGAGCLGHALLAGLAGEGPLALRHVNLPVLMRIGWLAAKVRADARSRAELAPRNWEQLLAEASAPWLLEDASVLDAAVSSGPL